MKRSRLERGLEILFLLVPIAATAAILSQLGRGLDLSDEGYYLMWARRPDDIIGVRNFGHYTGILYSLAGHSLRGFRTLGLLILLGSAAALAFTLHPETRGRLVFLATVSIGALGFYARPWIPTPSYNWLVLLALIAAYAGLQRGGLTGSAIFGASAVLAFNGKPPAAISLFGIGVLWWLFFRPKLGRLAAGAAVGASALTLFHAAAFDSPAHWYTQLRDGYAILSTLGSHDPAAIVKSLSAFLDIPKAAMTLCPIWLLAAPLALALKPHRLLCAAAILGLGVELAARGAWQGDHAPARAHMGMAAMLLLLGTTSAVFIQGRMWRTDLRVFLLPAALLAGAFAYALGSSNLLMVQAGGGLVFFTAAGALVSRLSGPAAAAAFGTSAAIGLALVLHTSFEHPYRLPAPLSGQTVEVTLGHPETVLDADPRTARYLTDLRAAAASAGFTPETPLIDLTGASPATTFALGARAPTYPWLPGQYPGSNTFAEACLRRAPLAELRRAWVLTSPDGERRLPPEILSRVGLDFPGGYTRVGGFDSPRAGETQTLWKPD